MDEYIKFPCFDPNQYIFGCLEMDEYIKVNTKTSNEIFGCLEMDEYIKVNTKTSNEIILRFG